MKIDWFTTLVRHFANVANASDQPTYIGPMLVCCLGRSESGSPCVRGVHSFEPLYTGWIVVVHLYCGFSLWCQMAPQQSAKFITAFFGHFRTSLRNDSVVNYESIWTPFSISVTGQDVLCNALNISQIRV